MRTNEVFLDTSYAIALLSYNDQYHSRAESLAEKLQGNDTVLVTTRAIVIEIGNALARMRYRRFAIELLNSLVDDPAVEIVPLSEPLCTRAFRLYCDRVDKEWGLTDCISFEMMQEHGLTDALTADEHFRQAGFRALLLEEMSS